MSKRLIGDFASCLEAKMAAPTEAAAEAIVAPDVKPISPFVGRPGRMARQIDRAGCLDGTRPDNTASVAPYPWTLNR